MSGVRVKYPISVAYMEDRERGIRISLHRMGTANLEVIVERICGIEPGENASMYHDYEKWKKNVITMIEFSSDSMIFIDPQFEAADLKK